MTKRSLTCIICPMGCKIEVELSDGKIFNIEGNACDRGLSYAKEECTSPKRILTTLVRVKDGLLPVTSVKTTRPIPKALILSAQKELSSIVLEAPLNIGNVVMRNILDTGADVIVTRSIKKVQNDSFVHP